MIDLSISNICSKEDPISFLDMCEKNEISKIEIAPTKIVSSIYENNKFFLTNFFNEIKNRNMTVESIQSIFFNNQFNIFIDKNNFLEHLKRIFEISNMLECNYIVFGSPKNRKLPEFMTKEDGTKVFIEAMVEISELIYENYGSIKFAIEANPETYGCNFIVNYLEAKYVLDEVQKDNIVFHLDTACTFLSGKSFNEAFVDNRKYISKIHISEPYLEPIINNSMDHQKIIQILHNNQFNGMISLEMKETSLENIVESIKFIKEALRTSSDGKKF